MKKSLQNLITYLRWKLYDEDFCLFAFFILLLVLLICCGCKSPKHINTETVVRYIDSTVVTYRDSLIEVEVPKERIVDVVALPDTLNMETSLATAKCWVDTTTSPNMLRGELENKPDGTLTKTIYLPSKEHIVYKDSIQTKEVPVYIDKVKTKTPKFIWWLLGVMGTLILIAYRKYIAKFFKVILTLF